MRFGILLSLLVIASCTKVHISGVVTDDATGDGIDGAIITLTDTTTNVSYNAISGGPSGWYGIDLPEGTYLRQAVHTSCNNVDPPQEIDLFEAFSPYVDNYDMDCP